MAKSPIVESHKKVLTGILDLENMSMEYDEIGVIELKHSLSKFDNQHVKITIELKNDCEE